MDTMRRCFGDIARRHCSGDIEQVVEFSDFRDVDGIKVPYTTRSTNAVQAIVVTMTDVKHNLELDESFFSKPAGQ